MSQLQVIEHKGQRVLTTAQLAEAFGTETKIISQNFNRNKNHYTEGKHYFVLTGEKKREILCNLQIEVSNKDHAALYLWTEKGAWMHAKSLSTDKAWEAYEMLVDDYYRVKQLAMNAQAPSLELQIKQQRAEAMAINAKTNRHKTVMKSLQDMELSPIAFQVAGITALEELIGKKIDYRPEVDKLYTATQIGLEAGVSKNMVGKIANANGLKTDEYGMMVLDKSPNSCKEVPCFRYNERGRQRLLELLKREGVETCQLSN